MFCLPCQCIYDKASHVYLLRPACICRFSFSYSLLGLYCIPKPTLVCLLKCLPFLTGQECVHFARGDGYLTMILRKLQIFLN